MRILAVLWTVCLVRLCSAGCCGGGTRDDDDESYGGSTENLRSQPRHVAPITLNLFNPDESKLEINTRNDEGVLLKTLTPKDGCVISSVMDGDKELWKSTAFKVSETYASRVNAHGYYCLSCTIYKHGNKEVLEMVVVENSSRGKKFFERNANSEWISIEKDDFFKKLNEMRKSE
ncbi:signal peptide containing protein [Theileria equi strain WA]|uniref:Signal peptide containing protein n=1 Tax=Theileria equi strain WA TaxID=1537102 RepID=L1LBQ6_THEEQ|nr:signal peptide containing protein [Theileria equi strain WA]EKX72700.1 signal peptide containing protein [Theileria equi strain WA]|eukprot:XP_004832152.1 signal peptide containing protein [Theileria equi strain WA]